MKKILSSKGVLDITLPPNPRTTPEGEYYMVCPICTPERKREHQKEKKFAINLSKHPVPWRCNHCGEGGTVLDDNYLEKLKIKPVIENIKWLELSDQIIEFFSKRKINRATLDHFKIRETLEPMRQIRHSNPEKIGKVLLTKTVNFPYFRNNMLIDIKYRDQRKNFKMIVGASKIFYNIDSIRDSSWAVIVEGEMDVLAYFEATITPVISVPNGAHISDKEKEHYAKTGEMTLPEEYRMEYLDNCIEDLDHLETVYLATDDDPAGIKLREQLARRIGKNRCRYIRFSKYSNPDGTPCKDANDVLIHHGTYELQQTITGSVPFPVDNVIKASSFLDEMRKEFLDGRSKGLPTGWACLDPHFLWMRGWTYLFNGFPGQGKSTMLFNLSLAASLIYKWPCGAYLPENYPIKNILSTMAEILIGNTADPRFSSRMSWDDLEKAVVAHIEKYFFFLDNDRGFSPEDLREKKEELVKKHGIVMFITDPWLALNHVERKKFGSIDEYINYEMNYEIRQAKTLNIINIFAHHPSTPIRDKNKEYSAPSAFEPLGGQIWYNKVFSMTCVHRQNSEDYQNTLTEFHVQKQKEQKLAGLTTKRESPILLMLDRRTNRYLERGEDDRDGYCKSPFDNYAILAEDELLNMSF
jgi:twinkle protein